MPSYKQLLSIVIWEFQNKLFVVLSRNFELVYCYRDRYWYSVTVLMSLQPSHRVLSPLFVIYILSTLWNWNEAVEYGDCSPRRVRTRSRPPPLHPLVVRWSSVPSVRSLWKSRTSWCTIGYSMRRSQFVPQYIDFLLTFEDGKIPWLE